MFCSPDRRLALVADRSDRFAKKNVLARDGIIVPFAAPTHGPLTFP